MNSQIDWLDKVPKIIDKQKAKELMINGNGSLESIKIGEFEGYDVFTSSLTFHTACFGRRKDNTHYILVGPPIRKFSLTEIEAIMYHELGHIMCNHSGSGMVVEEIEADTYAAKKMGKEVMVSVLNKLLTIYKSPKHVQLFKERLKALSM